MYKVTIQEAAVKLSDWKVVAAGTWTPGQRPQLDDQIVPAEVLDELFNVTPSATDRKQATEGATPLSDNAYKVKLAQVAVKRALLAAGGVAS